MDDAFWVRMKEICGRMLEEELEACRDGADEWPEAETTVPYVPSEEEITMLAKKIEALLPEDQSLLYLHYCFGLSDVDTGAILKIDRALEMRIYIEKVLAAFAGDCNVKVTEYSLRLASWEALKDYMADFSNTPLSVPVYTHKFRRQLKNIRAAQKTAPLYLRIAKQAAMITVAAGLTFSTAMVVNADFREWVIEWVVETFPEFTRFKLDNELRRQIPDLELNEYQINYIPAGFLLHEKFDARITITYRYRNETNEELVISIMSENAVSSYDTEDAFISKYILRDTFVYYWEAHGKSYMTWEENGNQFSIISTLNFDEVYKIAENIKK